MSAFHSLSSAGQARSDSSSDGVGRDQRFDPADERDDVVVDRGGARAGGGAAPRLLAGVGEAAGPAAVVAAGERREGAPFGQQPGEVRVEILGVLGGAGDERFARLDAGGRGPRARRRRRLRPARGRRGGRAAAATRLGEPRRVLGAAGVAGERGELGFQAIELGPGARRIATTCSRASTPSVSSVRRRAPASALARASAARWSRTRMNARARRATTGLRARSAITSIAAHLAEAIDGGDAGVVVLGRDRDGFELGGIGEALERARRARRRASSAWRRR